MDNKPATYDEKFDEVFIQLQKEKTRVRELIRELTEVQFNAVLRAEIDTSCALVRLIKKYNNE